MNVSPRWISDTDELSHWLETWSGGALALDTEADSLHHYPEKVCLVQLSCAGTDLLVDPLAGVDLELLRSPLEDPERVKILHGADYDLRMLHRDFKLEMRGIFDTMIAARLIGERAFGLAALLDSYLGVSLDKKFQRADWSKRPLSEPMKEYASLDTHYLHELRDRLLEKLESSDRLAWAEEEFRRLEEVRWTGGFREDGFYRIKGAGKLRPPALAILRALYLLREKIAVERDRPPFMIMRDDVMTRLATSDGTHPPERISGLPRFWMNRGRSEQLREAIDQARSLPEADQPERRRGERPKMIADLDANVRALAKLRDRRADELGIEGSLIASRATVEAMFRAIDEGEAWTTVDHLRGWQIEILEPLMKQL